MHVHATIGDNRRGFVGFPMPAVPANCQVGSAVMDLQAATVTPGRTIQVQRVTSAWDESTITWNNQPGVAGPMASLPSASTMSFDLTQQVLDIYATSDHGFRLRDSAENDPGDLRNGYQTHEGVSKPELTIIWADLTRTSTTLTTSGAVPAGESIILSFGMEDGGAGAVSASDGAGNTYSADVDVTNAGDARSVVLSAHDVNALSAGSSITVSHPAIASVSFAAYRFSGLRPTRGARRNRVRARKLFDPVHFGGGHVSSRRTCFRLDSGAIHVRIHAGRGLHGSSSGSGPDGSVNSEYKIVSTTGSYVGNGTLGVTADWTAAVADLSDGHDGPTVTVAQPPNGEAPPTTLRPLSRVPRGVEQRLADRHRPYLSRRGDRWTAGADSARDTGTERELVRHRGVTCRRHLHGAGDPVGWGGQHGHQHAGDVHGRHRRPPPHPCSIRHRRTALRPLPRGLSRESRGRPSSASSTRGQLRSRGGQRAPVPSQYTLADGDGTYTISVKQKDAAGNESPGGDGRLRRSIPWPETRPSTPDPTRTTG